MNADLLALFDIAPGGRVIGAIVAFTFFLVFVGIAIIAFKAMSRTVKMVFRLAIVGVIMVIAVIGTVSLWYFSSGGSPKLKPPAEKPARR